MYSLIVVDFSLELEVEVRQEYLLDPLNTVLDISITSNNYSARHVLLDVDVYDFATFADELNELYEVLEGKAKLTDVYGNSWIEFDVMFGGYISVSGCVHSPAHDLIFANSFDQTFLRDFAKALYGDYHNYPRKASSVRA